MGTRTYKSSLQFREKHPQTVTPAPPNAVVHTICSCRNAVFLGLHTQSVNTSGTGDFWYRNGNSILNTDWDAWLREWGDVFRNCTGYKAVLNGVKKPAVGHSKAFYGWTQYNTDHQKRSGIFSKNVMAHLISTCLFTTDSIVTNWYRIY
jgi:hypothetical protein